MPSSKERGPRSVRPATRLVHTGRNAAEQHGFINPPLYRGSTVLFPSVEALLTGKAAYTYGRKDSPTMRGLAQALAGLEGGHQTFLTSSGLSAVTASLLAFIEAGSHILVTDSVYQPARRFCDQVLTRLGVEVTYYDPLTGARIGALFRANTRLVLTESPGSQTFEVQDIPAIAAAARERGIWVLMDNTWATPLYFKPFSHGVDVSIQAATKYIVGHADAMLGAITASERASPHIKTMHENLGLCPGPEDCYLGLRGLRTLAVRLERHWRSGLAMAEWLAARPEVARVLHPALPGDPGHALWRRDFTGASGLFSVILQPASAAAVAAMLDGLRLFGMGYSYGGFESLVIPFHPASYRSATSWEAEGTALRFHIGLEDVEDLKADLEEGFKRLNAANDIESG